MTIPRRRSGSIPDLFQTVDTDFSPGDLETRSPLQSQAQMRFQTVDTDFSPGDKGVMTTGVPAGYKFQTVDTDFSPGDWLITSRS